MRKLLSCSMVMAFLCLAGPQDATAQGWGGFWNYMNKLSGPRTTGPGVSFYTEGGNYNSGLRPMPILGFAPTTPFRLRLSVDYQFSVSSDDAIDPDGSAINMVSATLAAERDFPLSNKVSMRAGLGYSLHRFFGDFDDAFSHQSARLYVHLVVLRIAQWGTANSNSLDLTFGPTGYRWPSFDATDFDPLIVDVDRVDAEYTWGLSIGVDWRR